MMHAHEPARGDVAVKGTGTAVDFTVIIVSYNTLEHLRACLATLADEASRASFRVIVVDNASSDGSPEMVRREFPGVTLHANAVNVGYSRAVNQAAREGGGRYFLVLNPDILVRPGSLGELVAFMDRNPRVGVAGGKLLNPDGSLQYSCRSFYTLRTVLYRRTLLGRIFPRSRVIRDHLMSDWDHATDREVDWVLGACMMVRREAVREVGLMDERFFLYFEDVDWCYRMKRRGWGVCYVAGAVMVHHHRRESARGGVTDPRFLNHLLSTFHFYDKWNRALLAMKRHRGPVRVTLLLLSDLVAVNLAFLTAYGLRKLMGVVLTKELFPIATYRFFLAFVNVATLFSFFAMGLYQRRPGATAGEEVLRIARAVFVSFLILMTGTFLAQSNLYSRSMVYALWPIAGAYAAVGRIAIARIHGRLRELQFDKRRVVLAGAPGQLDALDDEILRRPELGYDVSRVVPFAAGPGTGDPDLAAIAREEEAEEVLLAGRGLDGGAVARMILECREAGVMVTVVSDASELVALGGRLMHVGGHEALGFPSAVLRGPARAAKRGGDILLAIAGLLFLWPFAALAAARARRRARMAPAPGRHHEARDGGGLPFIARHRVVGAGGEPFDLLAFGVPVARAHEVPFRYLAPAFLNVLRGEASFVGPRPRAVGERPGGGAWSDLLARERPGLTGLWRFARPGADPDEADRRWLRSRSFAFDLQVLIDTMLGRSP